MQFVRFSYYKIANRTAPCGVVRCGAVQYYLQCDAIMPFCGRYLRFMRFAEHPYINGFILF